MKKISDILQALPEGKSLFSFEFFPPKDSAGEERLFQTVAELKKYSPAFVSVTYGAGGSTRERTKEWVTTIQDRYDMVAMAHLTCVGSPSREIGEIVRDLHSAGIRNIMALRGDPPKDQKEFRPVEGGFRYASELIAYLRTLDLDLGIGAAAYPEKHTEAATLDEDIAHLRTKVDAGSDFLVTQLFFDNRAYFSFVEKCRKAGITSPILPGIMPITAFNQIERFTAMAGCTIPDDLRELVTRSAEDPQRLQSESIAWSIGQCRELIEGGAPGIHFYTLNKSSATRQILEALL